MFTWHDPWSIVLSDVIFGALSDMIFGASSDVILVVFCYPFVCIVISHDPLSGCDYMEFLLTPLFPSSCLPWEQRVCGYGWLPVVTGE